MGSLEGPLYFIGLDDGLSIKGTLADNHIEIIDEQGVLHALPTDMLQTIMRADIRWDSVTNALVRDGVWADDKKTDIQPSFLEMMHGEDKEQFERTVWKFITISHETYIGRVVRRWTDMDSRVYFLTVKQNNGGPTVELLSSAIETIQYRGEA